MIECNFDWLFFQSVFVSLIVFLSVFVSFSHNHTIFLAIISQLVEAFHTSQRYKLQIWNDFTLNLALQSLPMCDADPTFLKPASTFNTNNFISEYHGSHTSRQMGLNKNFGRLE